MTASIAAESAGTALLKALLNEIRQLPKPWEQTPEREQEVVIDRLRKAVETVVRNTVLTIAAGSYPRIPAEVDSVTFKDGVKAVLKLPKGHDGTHALADSQGGQAIVVLASHAEFVDGMHKVRGDADQPDMFEAEHSDDPPAVPEAWQALLDSLEQGPPDETSPPKSIGLQCQERLAKVFVYVELEVCEAWSEQECTVAAFWAIEYAKDPENCKVARPHWLPLPQPPGMNEGGGDENTSDGADDDQADGDGHGDEPAQPED